MNDVVTYESRDSVAIITINRPDRLNAIDADVEAGLARAWKRLNESDDRVGILTGAGNKAFSAGKDMRSSTPPDYRGFTPGVGVIVDKPLIAAVGGWCIGGAIVLVQMCDLCVAANTAKFIYPEATMGFAGGMIASIAGRIPHKIAMELMLLGEEIGAERAYQVGFVNKLTAPGQHLVEAEIMAHRLARNAPLVMAMLKRFTDSVLPKSPVEQAGYAWRENNAVFTSNDYAEGLTAFKEKRPPRFTGS